MAIPKHFSKTSGRRKKQKHIFPLSSACKNVFADVSSQGSKRSAWIFKLFYKSIFKGRGGGGQVVSVLAFYSNDPSLIPLFCKNVVKMLEQK